MNNEDIAISLKEKLRNKDKLFKIVPTNREVFQKMQTTQSKTLKKILKHKLDYERRHESSQGIVKCVEENEQEGKEEKSHKG